MSKPNDRIAPAIPVGILVAPPAKVRSAERPAPRRRVVSSGAPLPWLKIAAGGSIGWVAVMLVVAWCTVSPERPRSDDPPLPFGQVAVEAQAPKPKLVAQANPVVAPVVAEPVEDIQPKPILPRRVAPLVQVPPKVDDLPPLIDVPIPAPAPPQAEPVPPQPEPAAPIKPVVAKKEVDHKVYANCAQIGTNILFMKNPPDAFKKAREEKKLVFVVHLSGNLEDKDFT